MSNMVAIPRPPSTTGTTTWLISSTSPAPRTAPLKVPPPSRRSFLMPRTPRSLSSATVTSTSSFPAEEIRDACVLQMREIVVRSALAHEQHHVVAFYVRLVEPQLALRVRADGESARAPIGHVIRALDPAPRAGQLPLPAGELAHRRRP